MTIGHGLIGLSIGAIMIPPAWNARRKLASFLAMVLAAYVPDLPLPHWGHDLYYISHSLFVTLGLMAVAAGILWRCPRLRGGTGGWPLAGALMLAWASHLLLDSFYAHGGGVAMFWPLSRASLALPMPWFGSLHRPFLVITRNTVRVFAAEAVFYGTVLAACLAWRFTRNRLRAEPAR